MSSTRAVWHGMLQISSHSDAGPAVQARRPETSLAKPQRPTLGAILPSYSLSTTQGKVYVWCPSRNIDFCRLGYLTGLSSLRFGTEIKQLVTGLWVAYVTAMMSAFTTDLREYFILHQVSRG